VPPVCSSIFCQSPVTAGSAAGADRTTFIAAIAATKAVMANLVACRVMVRVTGFSMRHRWIESTLRALMADN
jgi:hypothetical protein